jgi:hypothetical protein
MLIGDGGWEAKATGAHFDTRQINGKAVYSMPVIVPADRLMLLKWHDLAKEKLRVLSEKPI